MKSALKDGTAKGIIMSEMIVSRIVVKPSFMPDFGPFVIFAFYYHDNSML